MGSVTQSPAVRVVVGVDTHKDFHVAHARDSLGRRLGEHTVRTTSAGYLELLSWAQSLGEIEAFGIEGAASFGAGLTRFLFDARVRVLEVGRPKRQHRARHGKSDTRDAESAAITVLSGDELGVPKSADGTVEMIRMLRMTRASAVRAKTIAVVEMQDLLITAPEDLRARFSGLTARRIVRMCARFDAPTNPGTPTDAALVSLVLLARRYEQLEEEAKELERQMTLLLQKLCPELLELCGVGADIAATLLVALGDNHERIGSEAAFAKLCGVSPVDASSGRQVRHRLNRGGNRQANRALYMLVVVRIRCHQPTKEYVARRIAEGKTKKEIIRCLKRYVVRELYNAIRESTAASLQCSTAA